MKIPTNSIQAFLLLNSVAISPVKFQSKIEKIDYKTDYIDRDERYLHRKIVKLLAKVGDSLLILFEGGLLVLLNTVLSLKESDGHLFVETNRMMLKIKPI